MEAGVIKSIIIHISSSNNNNNNNNNNNDINNCPSVRPSR